MVVVTWVMLFLISAVSVGIFFKPILEEFGWDRATLSSVHTAALVVFALVTPFLGRFIDRHGPRLMLFICLVTQTLSSVVNGLASGIGHIFAGRLLYEIKSTQASQVLLNHWFIRKRGKAQGIAATGMPVGALLLSPLSQYLVLTWGWRTTLFFWAGVAFVVLLPLTLMVRNTPDDKGDVPDGRTYGVDSYSESRLAPDSLASAVYTLAGALRSGAFWMLAATQLICGIGCGFMMTHVVIFATDIGYTEMIGATFVSVQGGLNLVGVLVTGHMSDRHARNKVLALTHCIRSVSFFVVVVSVIAGGGPLWLLYAAMALFGFGWFTTSPLTSGLVADLFGTVRMGTIIGITMSCHTAGMALGAYAGGITYELTGSYYTFFLVQGILEFLAAGFALAVRRPNIRHKYKNC